MKTSTVVMLGLVTVLLFNFAAVGNCQENQVSAKATKVTKEVQGEVTGKGMGMIAIAYRRDPVKGTEEELLLPYDDTIQLVHKKNMKEINVGDTVVIHFDETTETIGGNQNVSRKAMKLRFVKSAPAAPAEPAAPATSEPNK